MYPHIWPKKRISAVTAFLLVAGLTVTGVAWASDTPTANPPGVRSDGHSVDLAQVPSKAPALDANGDQLRDNSGNALCIDLASGPMTPPTKADFGVDADTDFPDEAAMATRELTAADTVRCD